jgi:hypothetical protein
MDRGVVPPCLELGSSPEHRLLTWAGRHTGRQDLLLLSENRLEYRVERAVPGADMGTFDHLEDAGYVERVTIGESYRYRVLIFCLCEGSGGNPQSSSPAPRWELILSRSDGMSDRSKHSLSVGEGVGGSGVFNGVKSESAQKPVATTTYLAKYFFPGVVREAGIQMVPLQTNGPALAHHLNRWKLQGVDLSFMKLMMEEFVRHPEWCRHSTRPPWRVFVSRREDLSGLVVQRAKQNTRSKDWFAQTARHTPRVNYAT